MKIISINPGHDGAIAYLRDAKLIFSIEAEKDSNYRYSPISSSDVFKVLGELDEIPDVVSAGGWWPRDHAEHLRGSDVHAGYRGVSSNEVIMGHRLFLGKTVHHFSSSHERSHVLCAFGMSSLPKGTQCYALIWEGAIGAFYEIDAQLNIKLVANVLNQPGNRYGQLYGLADPSFLKLGHPRFSDAGKLMALASFSNRSTPTLEEQKLLDILLAGTYREINLYNESDLAPYHNAGLDNQEFRNFAGIFSDRIFDIFYRFAISNLQPGMPLVIAGGCGLNCDWNTKWKDSGFFSEVFVPPVANDSGSAIGTAIDAQFHFTGNPKIDWNVYSGLDFNKTGNIDLNLYDVLPAEYGLITNALSHDLILGWVQGKYEIGPRALGNRSILAAPFRSDTRERLNRIKQREQFRPIAPICLEEDAMELFGCNHSPHMLFTHYAKTRALSAVTHVNGSSRIQTVSSADNQKLHELLLEFKALTGYGVLCNTSLNYNGKGFINNMTDLSGYATEHNLDGFVVEDRVYFLKASTAYRRLLALSRACPPVAA